MFAVISSYKDERIARATRTNRGPKKRRCFKVSFVFPYPVRFSEKCRSHLNTWKSDKKVQDCPKCDLGLKLSPPFFSPENQT